MAGKNVGKTNCRNEGFKEKLSTRNNFGNFLAAEQEYSGCRIPMKSVLAWRNSGMQRVP